MKNEDLYVYKKSDFYEDFISSQKEYYEREQVDMLLAEKDREIALLKERICNGDVSRLTWIDDCLAKDKEIAELKAKLESVQASMYCEVVDAGMENRKLKRALWLARAERAKEHVWHDVKTDGSPRDDYKGHDWVLVQYQENGGFLLIPRIAEYRKNLKRWVLIDENDITPHHDYLSKDCRVIGWRDIDFAYYGRKFFVQQEINKNVERKCLKKAEEYK